MRALLVTHGRLGIELAESAKSISGIHDAPLDVLSNRGLDSHAMREAIGRWLGPGDEPALVLVDFGGGSCGIAAQLAAAGRAHTWVIGGVNLPMVLTYLGRHSQLDPARLVMKILDRAVEAVRPLDGEA